MFNDDDDECDARLIYSVLNAIMIITIRTLDADCQRNAKYLFSQNLNAILALMRKERMTEPPKAKVTTYLRKLRNPVDDGSPGTTTAYPTDKSGSTVSTAVPGKTPETPSDFGVKNTIMEMCETINGPNGGAVNDMKSKLMLPVAEGRQISSRKVTVVGAGNVGVACVISLLTKGISSEICLMDSRIEKAVGEALDINHGSHFIDSARVVAGDADFKACADSKVIVITAGARQEEGEDRLSLLQRNADILKTMIPQLAAGSPDAIFLVVSNPVDILTYITWKLSGFPQNRVFGSGTNLDSARFRYLLANRLGVAAESCEAYIIGEHGDSSVAVWSAVSVAGTLLRSLEPTIGTEQDSANWKCIHAEVVRGAYDVIKLKGFTNWAIGFSVADLISSIFNNKNKIHCISVPARGMYGIDNDAYLSLPCVLGECGYTTLIKQTLTDEEEEKLRQSAKILSDNIEKMKL